MEVRFNIPLETIGPMSQYELGRVGTITQLCKLERGEMVTAWIYWVSRDCNTLSIIINIEQEPMMPSYDTQMEESWSEDYSKIPKGDE